MHLFLTHILYNSPHRFTFCRLVSRTQSKHKYSAHRELSILERVGSLVSDPDVARKLADALVAMIAAKASASKRGRGGSALNELGLARALGALAALCAKAAGEA